MPTIALLAPNSPALAPATPALAVGGESANLGDSAEVSRSAGLDHVFAPHAHEVADGVEGLDAEVAAVEDVNVAGGLVDGDAACVGVDLAGATAGSRCLAVGGGRADLESVLCGVLGSTLLHHVPAPGADEGAVGGEGLDSVVAEIVYVDGARGDSPGGGFVDRDTASTVELGAQGAVGAEVEDRGFGGRGAGSEGETERGCSQQGERGGGWASCGDLLGLGGVGGGR